MIRALLLSSRPLSWINTAFPFAAAYLLATREIDARLIVGTVFFLVPYNLAMYGINDVFDYESDLRNPRKGGVEGALLDTRLHRPTLIAAAVTTIPFVIALVLMGGPVSWVVLAVSLFAVIAYSAPVLRFKERPVLDSITSSTHFVSPAVYGLALAGAAVDAPLALILTSFFLWGIASHAFGAVQDIGADREAGIGSIATVLGGRATVRIAFAAYLLAGVLLLVAGAFAHSLPAGLASVLAVPYAVMVAPWLNVADADAADANRGWRRFLAINFGCGFLVTLILIWYAVGT